MQRHFRYSLIVRETSFRIPDNDSAAGIQALYGRLTTDAQRNELIFDDILHSLEAGRSPLVMTERRDHLEYFAERLRSMVRHVILLRGGRGVKQRMAAAEQLAEIPAKEERLVSATGRFAGLVISPDWSIRR